MNEVDQGVLLLETAMVVSSEEHMMITFQESAARRDWRGARELAERAEQ